MTCYHPLVAWAHKTRKSNTGKSIVVFSAPSNIGDYRMINVPCGQCIGCRLDYAKNWAIRCLHESKCHDENCFITLTYDDFHIPYSSVNGEQTLRSKDLQNFWKELRRHDDFKEFHIRYFACGEYGDNTYRPHYHAILFGINFPDRQLYKVTSKGNYYLSNILDSVWKKGHTMVCDVSYDTCCYVARYVTKKLNGVEGDEAYEGIEKPFCRMSRRPGIGAEWFERYHSDVYPFDEVVYRNNGTSFVVKPPRYYDNLYDLRNPDSLAEIKEKRVLKMSHKLDELSQAGRLDDKEKYQVERLKGLERSKTDVDVCGIR